MGNILNRSRAAEVRATAGGQRYERDLVMTDADFQKIATLIYKHAGIVLADNKRNMVYSRLAKHIRDQGMTHFSQYLARLEQSSPGGKQWEAFTNALTTNLTAFFREAHHFPLLAEHVAGRTGPVRVWSAAASTGEEPYSIAMTLMEALGPNHRNIEVVGTDIDTDALHIARTGIYPVEQVKKLGPERTKRFFLRGTGRNAGLAKVKPELANIVDFQPLNLLAPNWPLTGQFDAIFCRNVMIYFDKKTQARILTRFAPLLKPDGLLITGHSENFTYITKTFRLRGQTIYELVSNS